MSRKRHTGFLPSGLLGVALVLILVGERILGDGTIRLSSSIAGLFIFLVANGIRIRNVLNTSGDMRKTEIRLLLCYGGILLSLVLYGLTTEWGVSRWGLTEQTTDHLSTILSVLWPSMMLTSLLALLFMELVFARMPSIESVEIRRVRTASYAGLTLAFAVIFLFSINYVANERDVRRDVSYFRTTKPSHSTLDLIHKLDQPLRIILFYRPSDDVLSQIRPYFSHLDKESNQIKLETVDYAIVPELSRKHRIRENGTVLLLRKTDKDEKGESFKIGLELTKARSQLRKLDGLFQEHFRKLNRPEYSLKFTVGHGERNTTMDEKKPGDRTQGLNNLLKRLNISTSKLGIAQGLASSVPEDISAVAVIGPSEKFLEEESQALLSYVQKGGRLLLMLDSDQNIGLDPLLEGLGIELLPGVIASERHFLRQRFQKSDNTIVYSNVYSSHPIVTTVSRHRTEVATIFSQGVAISRMKDPKATPQPKVTFPLRSTPDFWRDLDNDFIREQGEDKQGLNMIAAITLSQKGFPEGRAVVIGDGDFITDKLINNSGNNLVFIDSLAWLIADEQISSEVTSEEDIPIQHTDEEDKVWFYVTTFAVPLPILFAGVWIARRRRRRQEAKR